MSGGAENEHPKEQNATSSQDRHTHDDDAESDVPSRRLERTLSARLMQQCSAEWDELEDFDDQV